MKHRATVAGSVLVALIAAVASPAHATPQCKLPEFGAQPALLKAWGGRLPIELHPYLDESKLASWREEMTPARRCLTLEPAADGGFNPEVINGALRKRKFVAKADAVTGVRVMAFSTTSEELSIDATEDRLTVCVQYQAPDSCTQRLMKQAVRPLVVAKPFLARGVADEVYVGRNFLGISSAKSGAPELITTVAALWPCTGKLRCAVPRESDGYMELSGGGGAVFHFDLSKARRLQLRYTYMDGTDQEFRTVEAQLETPVQ